MAPLETKMVKLSAVPEGEGLLRIASVAWELCDSEAPKQSKGERDVV